ncbi:MAG: Holliday junction branch migration protein RuvA [FCB group bacterium]|nr:Holliday junction branch migration protein RuvA [FCB group bacterium]
MIDSISGKLIDKTPAHAIIDLHGLRLNVFITVNTYERLPDLGQPVELLTFLHVREDILALYGFHSNAQRELFLMLTGISGIGPRSAIGILSGTGVEEFKNRIISGDVKSLTVLPGIGPKTAKRIIVELKEKFVADEDDSFDSVFTTPEHETLIGDTIAALQSLGYTRSQAHRVTKRLEKAGDLSGSLEEIIRKALALM